MLQSARRFCWEAIIASAFNYDLIRCVNKYLRNFAVPWPLTSLHKRPSNDCRFSKDQMNIIQVHGLSFNQFLHPCTHTFTASTAIANNRFIKEEQKLNPFHITKNSISGMRFHTRPLKSSQSNEFSADNHSALDMVHRLKNKKLY